MRVDAGVESTGVPSSSGNPTSTLLSLRAAARASSAAQSASRLAFRAFSSAAAANMANCEGTASEMVGSCNAMLSRSLRRLYSDSCTDIMELLRDVSLVTLSLGVPVSEGVG